MLLVVNNINELDLERTKLDMADLQGAALQGVNLVFWSENKISDRIKKY